MPHNYASQVMDLKGKKKEFEVNGRGGLLGERGSMKKREDK